MSTEMWGLLVNSQLYQFCTTLLTQSGFTKTHLKSASAYTKDVLTLLRFDEVSHFDMQLLYNISLLSQLRYKNTQEYTLLSTNVSLQREELAKLLNVKAAALPGEPVDLVIYCGVLQYLLSYHVPQCQPGIIRPNAKTP